MLKIGIDASRAVRQVRTGTEHYSRELIRNLVEIDKTNQYILYAPHPPKDQFAQGENVTWKILPQRRLWSQIRLAREVVEHPPDILFVPSHVVPLLSNVPAVVTIHDLAYKYFPRAYSIFDRRYMNFTTGVSIGKAKKVIVPSEATKADVLKEYPSISSQKLVVVAHGYNSEVFNIDTQLSSPLEGRYIFYVGRIEEKKNVGLLVDAFSLLAKEKNPPLLVLAGKSGYGAEEIEQKIARLPERIRSRILLTGYMPTYDVTRYLKHAAVFAFPSLYEGFGMPIIEAMAMGTPVVCSNTPALAEVAGRAAVLLKPENPLTWAGALSRVINQPGHAKELRAKGLAQAQKYSWRKTAEETLKVLEDAAKK